MKKGNFKLFAHTISNLKTLLLIDLITKELNINYTYNKMKHIKVTVHKIMPVF
jgi:hypothetical protein